MDFLPAVELPAAPAGPVQRLADGLQERFFPGAMDTCTARWIGFLLILLAAGAAGAAS